MITAADDLSPSPDIDSAAPPEGCFLIEPVPEGLTGESFDKLMDKVIAHAKSAGFDIVKRSGTKKYQKIAGQRRVIPGSVPYRRQLDCACFGQTKNTRHLSTERLIRQRGIKKNGCRSHIIAVASNPNHPEGAWEIRHPPSWNPAHHSHPSMRPQAFAGHRVRSLDSEVIGFIQGQ